MRLGLDGVGTFAATTLIERAKWRRNQDGRWDDKRLAAHSEYANSVKTCAQLAYRVTATRGYPANDQPIDGLMALASADADRTVKWESVLLLGSPAAISASAARHWHEGMWKLSLVARLQDVDHAVYVELFDSIGRRRNEFYECARADLGIRSGTLPPDDRAWLPPAGA
ncbi:hypothetical protein [Nocardia amikacinitolerans]|uniref:hypothetical protein n=1 Tax=Nocardia amikacinitolerans TaxID=756689 RepID=UPI001FE41A89|nr:hypothetical protein [Nocardia amikacinitolerans]